MIEPKETSLDEEESKEYDSDIQLTPTEPPPIFSPVDSNTVDSVALKNANDILFEKMIQSLREVDTTIQRKIDALESLDITIQIVDYKIFEATHEFKTKIKEVKQERDQILASAENRSELSLILNSLDQKILDLERELDLQIKYYNHEKIEYQEKAEALIFQLEEDHSLMQENLKQMKDELEGAKNTMYKAQFMILNKKYEPLLDEFEQHFLQYEKLQTTGWKMENSEIKLSAMLLEKGLTFTSSGKLLTRNGSIITFHEAQTLGYFSDFRISIDKIIQLFNERDQQQNILHQARQPDTDATACSGASSIESKMSSEDVRYLKQHVGKPLALGIAEIIAKHPRDPIHYLGHYLFKYRYNQELDQMQKKEIDDLTQQRKIIAQERWQKFVEEEARTAVIEMILRAEQKAYDNELKRIAKDQMLTQEEETEENYDKNELLEEARDKFE